MQSKSLINNYLEQLLVLIRDFPVDEIMNVADLIIKTRNVGGTIYVCGNGGSGSTASHFANDFNKGLYKDDQPSFNVVCLNDNIATILAIGNDLNFNDIFSLQVKNRIRNIDLLILFSGSGNSQNLINAINVAKSAKATCVGILGFNGGKLKSLTDYSIHVRINDMQISEDFQLIINHILMLTVNNLIN